jgi:uncharacterized protein (DUF1330 family)
MLTSPLFWIVIGAFLLIIILLLAFKKYTLLTILVVLTAGAGFYGYKEYTRTNKDMSTIKADVSINASDLIKEYEANESASNKKYLGKVLEVTGNVKNNEKNAAATYTIVLGDTTGMSSVRCTMDSSHIADAANLMSGSSVTLRGACTGFNKDEMGLGSDVILNRCVIVTNKK